MGVVVCDFNKEKLNGFLNRATNDFETNTSAYKHCIKADALRLNFYYFEAIEEYQKSIFLEKNNPEAYRGMGIAHRETGNLKIAIEALETARKLAPFDKITYYELACYYIKKNLGCPAIKNLVRAIKIDPSYIDAQFKLACSHELIEEYEMAVIIYNKIIEQRPSYIDAYNSLGSLLIRLKRYKDSVKVFKTLLKINPEYTRAHLGIAIALDKVDRHGESIKYYKKYLEKKPTSGNSVFIKGRIATLRAERSFTNKSHLKIIG